MTSVTQECDNALKGKSLFLFLMAIEVFQEMDWDKLFWIGLFALIVYLLYTNQLHLVVGNIQNFVGGG